MMNSIIKQGIALCLVAIITMANRAYAIPSEDTHIVINVPAHTLTLLQGDTPLKNYPVGVGRPGFQTPLGNYKVTRMIISPIWEHPYMPKGKVRIRPGAANPLGTRWIGFKPYHGGEYGIHGTNEPSSVGRYSSHGCVRMRIKDAEDLFKQVRPGIPVNVVYQPVVFRQNQNHVQMVVYGDAYKKGIPTADKVLDQLKAQFPNAHVDENRIRTTLNHPQGQAVAVGDIVEPIAKGQADPSIGEESAAKPNTGTSLVQSEGEKPIAPEDLDLLRN